MNNSLQYRTENNEIFKIAMSLKKLDEKPRGFDRYKITSIIKKSPLAFLVVIHKAEFWLPQSECKIGLHKSGYFYIADIPKWLANLKKIPANGLIKS